MSEETENMMTIDKNDISQLADRITRLPNEKQEGVKSVVSAFVANDDVSATELADQLVQFLDQNAARSLIDVCRSSSIPNSYMEKSMSQLWQLGHQELAHPDGEGANLRALLEAAAATDPPRRSSARLKEGTNTPQNESNSIKKKRIAMIKKMKAQQTSAAPDTSSSVVEKPPTQPIAQEKEKPSTKATKISSSVQVPPIPKKITTKKIVRPDNPKAANAEDEPEPKKFKKRGKSNRWTDEESEMLRDLCSRSVPKKTWNEIAVVLNEHFNRDKTGSMCHQHFRRVAAPSIKHIPWTESEDVQLMKLYKMHDGKWAVISKKLKGRTDTQCRRRWMALLQSE